MTRITALGMAVVALLLVGLGGRGIIHSPPSAEATQTTVTLFYGTWMHYLVLGIPGVDYSRQMNIAPV